MLTAAGPGRHLDSPSGAPLTTTTTAPRVNRRRVLWQRTRGEILDLAIAQVREGGPLALSLRGIAKSLGMTAPALYRYFEGAEDLRSAVADRFNTELTEAAAGRSETGDAAIAAVLADWAATRPGEWTLLLTQPRCPGARIVTQALRAYAGVSC